VTCAQVQTNLSFYLYGELDFAQEDELDNHLAACALCQLALAREKEWHASLNAERQDVSLELLSECRRGLRNALNSDSGPAKRFGWWSRLLPATFSPTRWSAQIAGASFLICVGFFAARLMDSGRLPSLSASNIARMGMLDLSNTRVRDVQPEGVKGVRIVVDRVQQQEVTGTLDDASVRRLLFAAMHDSNNPALRVDSVEILQHQTGTDIRDALLSTAKSDPNAAVRIKALEGLRQFADDPLTRLAIEFVLKHDGNPDVRSEAIDVLLPVDQQVAITPDLLRTLEDIADSERENEYVRARSLAAVQAFTGSAPVY
jgi:hypothetical protein